MGLIPGVATLVLLLQKTLFTFLHSTELYKLRMVLTSEVAHPAITSMGSWVPGNKWGSKCQTASHVLLMDMAHDQVGLQVPIPRDMVEPPVRY